MKSTSYQYICIVAMVLTAFCLGGCEKETEKEKEAGPWKKWEIEWVAGGKFSQSTKVVGRFGRLQRNELWGPLPGYSIGGIDYLADEVLALDLETFEGDEKTRKDVLTMQRYAYFYKARSRGKKVGDTNGNGIRDIGDATEEEIKQIKDDLKKAVELGYTNPDEIRNAEKELFYILEDAEIVELLKDLDDKAEKRRLAGYSTEITKGFSIFTKAEKKNWRPALKTTAGEAFWPEGSPSIVVLSRIHHDGLNKFLQRFEKVVARKAPGIPLRLVFYQHKEDNKTRLDQTTDYAKALGSASPYSVIDRSQYLALREILRIRLEEGTKKYYEKQVEQAGKDLKAAEAALDNAMIAFAKSLDMEPQALKKALGDETGLVKATIDKTGEEAKTAKVAFDKATKNKNGKANILRNLKKIPALDIFQPVVLFFDADGVPLYLTNGVLENEQIEFALAGFASATGTGPK